MSPKKARKSLSLRLQPYQGTVLAEVVDYLNSLERDELSQQVAHALIMCFLPLARRSQGESVSASELRVCCLEACDALSKHASFLRQALRVPQPQFDNPVVIAQTASLPQGTANPSPSSQSPQSQGAASSAVAEEDEPRQAPAPSIQGQGSAAEVAALFGEV